jgi:hypothetical protein
MIFGVIGSNEIKIILKDKEYDIKKIISKFEDI